MTKRVGYAGLRKFKVGNRICEKTIGPKRCGIVVKSPTARSGWFKIRWDGRRKAEFAHANWFYTLAEYRRLGLLANPGAAWHESRATEYDDIADKEDPGSWRWYKSSGRASAHHYSADESRRLGIPNPRKVRNPKPNLKSLAIIGAIGVGLYYLLKNKV